ncbi:dCTP deaminase [Pseudarthrobacter siccitolerans]
MILTGPEIQKQVSQGAITIEPFSQDQVNPNSYDFRLASTLLTYDDHTLDAAAPNPSSAIEIPEDGMVLRPDRVYLGATAEKMGSNNFVPIIRGKSSIARLGLFINITADLIDLGSFNNWTLQLHAVQPLRIYPGMLIGQVTFWIPQGARSLYRGKYQGATGPRASESFRDFLPDASHAAAGQAR